MSIKCSLSPRCSTLLLLLKSYSARILPSKKQPLQKSTDFVIREHQWTEFLFLEFWIPPSRQTESDRFTAAPFVEFDCLKGGQPGRRNKWNSDRCDCQCGNKCGHWSTNWRFKLYSIRTLRRKLLARLYKITYHKRDFRSCDYCAK